MPYRPLHLFTTMRFGALALGLVLLVGCQGGTPSAPGTTTATPTPSATAQTTPAPGVGSSSGVPSPGVYKPADAKGKAENVPVPVMPELAKEYSKEGLEAFIRYWYAVGNYANKTGDVSELATLSQGSCNACAYFLKAAQDSNRDGRWLVGGDVLIPTLDIEWESGQKHQQARVQVVQNAITYYNPDGTEGRPSDPATNDAFVVTANFASTWKVADTGVIR